MGKDFLAYLVRLKWPAVIGVILFAVTFRNAYMARLRYEIDQLEREKVELTQELTQLRLQRQAKQGKVPQQAPVATIELPELLD